MAFTWSLISGETRAFKISVQFTGPNVTQEQAARYPAILRKHPKTQQSLAADDRRYSRSPPEECTHPLEPYPTAKKGESARRRPPLVERSGYEHLRRQVPKSAIDPHVLSEGRDPTRMAEISVRRPTGQAAPQQVLLDAIQRAPEIVRLVLDPTAAQKLRGLHAGFSHVRVAHRHRRVGELELLVPQELSGLHTLDLAGQDLKLLGDAKRARDHLIDDVAPVRHTDTRERPARYDEPVRADDPKDAHAELVGARSVMAVQEDNLRHGVPKLRRRQVDHSP